MNHALWVAKTGLDAQQTRISVIANNLANVNTNGFKKSRAVFEDLVYQNVRQPGAQSSQETQLPSGLMLGTGVRTVATERLYTQGNPIQTDHPRDVAIEGRGVFQVRMPDGPLAYTRDGACRVHRDGTPVPHAGLEAPPGPVIPDNALSGSLSRDGIVSATVPGSSAAIEIGMLQIADFVNPAGLQAIGQNLLVETAASGPPQLGTPG